MWPATTVFVRHAESVGNTMTADARARAGIGTNLYALTPRGEEQARATSTWLRTHFPNPDGFYTSYYTRTRATAALLSPDREPYVDERLAEAQRGIWHVMTREEITTHLPWEIRRKELEGLFHHRPIGGENWPDIRLRVRSFNHMVHRRYAGRTLVVVVHGFWLLMWKSIIHHWTIDETEALYTKFDRDRLVENASVTIYRGVEREGRNVIIPDPEQPYVIPWMGTLHVAPGTPA